MSCAEVGEGDLAWRTGNSIWLTNKVDYDTKARAWRELSF